MKTKSPNMNIDMVGIKKVGKGALIAGSAVALTFVAENIGSIDFGNYTGLVVGLVSIVINFARKYLAEY